MVAEPDSIAVIKPCCIGDAVMALPSIQALATRYPNATIDVFAGPHSRQVFEHSRSVGEVRDMPDIPNWRTMPGIVRQLRRNSYHLIVNLDRSRLVKAAVYLARVPGTLEISRPTDQFRHESDIYRDTIPDTSDTGKLCGYPRLTFNQQEIALAEKIASSIRGRYMIIQAGGATNPGASMLGKRWPLERYIEVAMWAASRGLKLVFTGSGAERQLARCIIKKSGAVDAYNLAGKLSLLESAAVCSRADLYLGADTGMSHLTAATGTPTVVVFGPTNPLRYAPRGRCVRIVAPEQSYSILDVDLRRTPGTELAVSTSRIDATTVIRACEANLDANRLKQQC